MSAGKNDVDTLRAAKRRGFSDKYIAQCWQISENDVWKMREANDIFPVYKMIDTCASEFDSYIPYFYSTYETENESVVTPRKKIVVLGSGPIRIGQGVEFDYSTVHAVMTIKKFGIEAIIINNNPETVSTDYTTSDKLYFEPLTTEDVMNIIRLEQPMGVITSLGGQTAINLAQSLMQRGVKIIGTDFAAIERAENRDAFEKIMEELQIPQPRGMAVTNIEDGVRAAEQIGYPVLVRPSYVLGGRAMQIVANEAALRTYLKTAVEVNEDAPVLVDKYISGKELEVDAVCDGTDVFVPGIMEHVERTGVHSGDSISVYPTFSVSQKVKEIMLDYTKRLGLGIGIVGLYNIQFIVDKDENIINELAPRFTGAMIGDCTKEGVLRSLGVNNFDICFVTISDNFQSSLEITSLLKELGAKYVVSKANRDLQAKFLLRNGADEVVYPERDIAEKLAIRHNAKNIFDFVEVTDDFAIFEIPILKKWAGKSISEIDVRKTYHINVLAIKKGGNLKVLPEANYVFDQSDHIIVIGKPADVFKLTNRT